MARDAVLSRSSVALRDPGAPQSYNVQMFGDSLTDLAQTPDGSMGHEIPLFTSQLGSIHELANGGHTLTQIATTFAAQFDSTDFTINTVYLSGGHNDLNTGALLSTMQTQMASMADAVIATGNHNLIIINCTPWGNNTNWTTALQTQLEAYNTWLDENYGPYVIDAYTVLNNGAADGKLDDPYYLTLTNSHPNQNAYRRVDQAISENLLYTRAATDLTEPAANTHGDYRDMTAWVGVNASNSAAGGIGGSVLLADGTYSNTKGIEALNQSIVTHDIKKNGVAIANGNTVRLTAYLKSGEVNRGFVRIFDGDLGNHQIYLDIKGVTLGTQVGTGTWTIEKATYGWVKVQMTFANVDTGGAGVIQVQVRAVLSGETASYAADDAYQRAPQIYVDAVSVEDLG